MQPFGYLPACECAGCQEVSQVGRIVPPEKCRRCEQVCYNPDCYMPYGGKRARQNARTGRRSFMQEFVWGPLTGEATA